MNHRVWPAIIVCITPLFLFASTPAASPVTNGFAERENTVSRALTRASQFVDVSHVSAAAPCEQVQPPEALTTPDPLFTLAIRGKKVKVSFIIGTDGRVHSPLILESAGLAGDRRVLQTVRSWRYRPATCNGVPTEIEGKVEFSGR